ncbi:hypothetical protein Sme01_01580 [Sphaerisporangium melleum]|uniref:HSP-70 cofactor n=1 Tax=Sphaerisporangium melleum TaxID=321316 RepID=A0A917R3N4_9ACTN|nr:nucleotide exchange factor GrpE [Sphaerisporangium melleum]GGK88448.1 hypothetical protein GCM10007964_33910 [Sphaerisporangium melleum]GII67682.1 hypothetical protein Sme01_01580 [Sphaerisporangium melleum]
MAPPPEKPREPALGGATPPAPSKGQASASREPVKPAESAEASEPAEASELAELAELARRVAELTRRLTALTEAAGREHERAAHREQVIDRLHAENQQLRHGLLQEALTPVRAGLYRLHDTVAREAARWQGPGSPPPERAGPLLSAIADEVAEVLGRTGAERAGVKAGDAYDPALHRPADTRPVEPGSDGTVVEVLSEAFAMGDRVLRKASVIVGRAAPEAGAEKTRVEKAQVEESRAGEATGTQAGEGEDARSPAPANPENPKKAKKSERAAGGDDPRPQRSNRKDGKAHDSRAGGDEATGRAAGGARKGSE